MSYTNTVVATVMICLYLQCSFGQGTSGNNDVIDMPHEHQLETADRRPSLSKGRMTSLNRFRQNMPSLQDKSKTVDNRLSLSKGRMTSLNRFRQNIPSPQDKLETAVSRQSLFSSHVTSPHSFRQNMPSPKDKSGKVDNRPSLSKGHVTSLNHFRQNMPSPQDKLETAVSRQSLSEGHVTSPHSFRQNMPSPKDKPKTVDNRPSLSEGHVTSSHSFIQNMPLQNKHAGMNIQLEDMEFLGQGPFRIEDIIQKDIEYKMARAYDKVRDINMMASVFRNVVKIMSELEETPESQEEQSQNEDREKDHAASFTPVKTVEALQNTAVDDCVNETGDHTTCEQMKSPDLSRLGHRSESSETGGVNRIARNLDAVSDYDAFLLNEKMGGELESNSESEAKQIDSADVSENEMNINKAKVMPGDKPTAKFKLVKTMDDVRALEKDDTSTLKMPMEKKQFFCPLMYRSTFSISKCWRLANLAKIQRMRRQLAAAKKKYKYLSPTFQYMMKFFSL